MASGSSGASSFSSHLSVCSGLPAFEPDGAEAAAHRASHSLSALTHNLVPVSSWRSRMDLEQSTSRFCFSITPFALPAYSR
eukprot:3453626-Pyramimonas_sp.AAC.1